LHISINIFFILPEFNTFGFKNFLMQDVVIFNGKYRLFIQLIKIHVDIIP